MKFMAKIFLISGKKKVKECENFWSLRNKKKTKRPIKVRLILNYSTNIKKTWLLEKRSIRKRNEK